MASEDDADTEEALKEFDFLVTAEDGEGAGEARSSGDGTEWGERRADVCSDWLISVLNLNTNQMLVFRLRTEISQSDAVLSRVSLHVKLIIILLMNYLNSKKTKMGENADDDVIRFLVSCLMFKNIQFKESFIY